VARIELAPQVLDDLDRFVEHMIALGVEASEHRVDELIGALDVLAAPKSGAPSAPASASS